MKYKVVVSCPDCVDEPRLGAIFEGADFDWFIAQIDWSGRHAKKKSARRLKALLFTVKASCESLQSV